MNRIQELSELLAKFDFTQKEIQIFIHLLSNSGESLSTLTQKLSIPRTTLSENLEKLMQKGLVFIQISSKSKLYRAVDKYKIEEILNKKKLELETTLKNIQETQIKFDRLFQEVISNSNEGNSNREIDAKIFKGREGIKNVYLKSLESEKIYSIANLENFYHIFPDGLNLFSLAKSLGRHREVWDLIFYTDENRDRVQAKKQSEVYKSYFVKFFKSKFTFTGFDYLIFDDFVGIIQLDVKNPQAVLIRSDIISKSLLLIHQTLWNLID